MLASFPSPSESVWHLGVFPIRAYALSIIVGIVVALVITERRFRARGGPPGFVLDVAVVAIPAGIIGARLYHVFTTPAKYFGADGDLAEIPRIWGGGLGIWGAVLGGAAGAWFVCRRRRVPLGVLGDALAPGLALAQAIGRFGNYFNQELYGRPLDAWWAVEIDLGHRTDGYLDVATYHPTFLYESLWCVGVALLVWWADRRYRLGGGRVFALYVMGYVVGRGWIEILRIDPAERFLDVRLNVWTSVLVFIGALTYFIVKRHALREQLFERPDGTVGVRPAPLPDREESSSPAEAEGDASEAEASAAPADTERSATDKEQQS